MKPISQYQSKRFHLIFKFYRPQTLPKMPKKMDFKTVSVVRETVKSMGIGNVTNFCLSGILSILVFFGVTALGGTFIQNLINQSNSLPSHHHSASYDYVSSVQVNYYTKPAQVVSVAAECGCNETAVCHSSVTVMKRNARG